MNAKKDNNNQPGRFDIDMSPFRDLMGHMDTFFNESFKQMNSFFKMRPFWVDVDERESEVIVTAELPGYKRDQIQLEIVGHQLRITAQGTSTHEAKNISTNDSHTRQSFQKSERTIALPFPILKRETKASFHDGLLKIVIPKKESEREYIDINDD
ncbi:Molecular chaperone IbpA, HSP20 family [Lentibacillus halodurans]|uniref:Molecular chaperone IbpA, HSP20 family n=1 Tax=Lentibacillus halodurans TaxID=237679 RepID=A0A1I0WA16_9BACI|nr:Hsp20/alpha crystallin family protein [Lentibacillus halodurans]SFA85118.1 Molecular chaperone IbpA, HSP20 family [Lentibacillus halodurans]